VIPPIAHFIWFGAQLPWVHALAIHSAARRGGFEQVILHHADDLSRTSAWPGLLALPGFVAQRIDVRATFEAAGASELEASYRELDAPAARANVLRAAILAARGGVYLDLDTVTIRSLEPLRRAHGAFCGEERVVWPATVRRSKSPFVHAGGLARAGVRELCRVLPDGWRRFRSIESHYPAAANNAVLAATPGHPFVRRLLANMIGVPVERRTVRFALGTHLLQDTLAHAREPDLCVLPPPVFYPLGPEISHHWFRERESMPKLDEVIGDETLVVHWYASVRTQQLIPRIDAQYVKAHAERQLFSALALPLLDDGGPSTVPVE
jgi:hypothetical protein